MIHEGECYFIDYQGGRRGAPQYDPASLLFEARTNIPFPVKEELLGFYLDELVAGTGIAREEFMKYYYPFVLVRILQTLGTYGLRGWVEKKALFMQSVPFAMKNIRWMLENDRIPAEFPELRSVLSKLSVSQKLDIKIPTRTDKLTVRIHSFSYLKQIPDDITGNGGGFVFDCRGINNPGRIEQYKMLSGLDEPVRQFLREKSEMEEFLSEVFSMVDRTIKSYIGRNYSHLQVSFGCTGGRHRSVYAAQKLADHLKQYKNVVVELEHREIDQHL